MNAGIAVVIATYRRPADIARLLENLGTQGLRPLEIRVVDASEDGATQAVVLTHAAHASFPLHWEAARVKGLPSQRMQGAAGTTAPLIAFLDDDVVLEGNFLAAMSDVFEQDREGRIGGACGYFTNEFRPLGWRWWFRRLFGLTFPLQPGRYYPTGHSCPLFCVPPFDGQRPMRYICGGLTVYRRGVFLEHGYSDLVLELYRAGLGRGEDLNLSLRVGASWSLVMQGRARAQHLHTPGGRTDPFRQGFAGIYNHYLVFRTCRPHRGIVDDLLFLYGQALDGLILLPGALRPIRGARSRPHLRGRLAAVRYLMRHRPGAIPAAAEVARIRRFLGLDPEDT